MKTLSAIIISVFAAYSLQAEEPNLGRYSGTIKVTTSVTVLVDHPDVISKKTFKFEKATLFMNGLEPAEGYKLFVMADMGDQPLPDSDDLLTAFYINTPSVTDVTSETKARRIKFTTVRPKIIGGYNGTVTYEGVFTWKAKP